MRGHILTSGHFSLHCERPGQRCARHGKAPPATSRRTSTNLVRRGIRGQTTDEAEKAARAAISLLISRRWSRLSFEIDRGNTKRISTVTTVVSSELTRVYISNSISSQAWFVYNYIPILINNNVSQEVGLLLVDGWTELSSSLGTKTTRAITSAHV